MFNFYCRLKKFFIKLCLLLYTFFKNCKLFGGSVKLKARLNNRTILINYNTLLWIKIFYIIYIFVYYFQLLTTAAAASATAPTSSTSSSRCCEGGRPIATDPTTGQSICSCQYNTATLLGYSRMAAGLGAADGVYTSAYAAQGYMPFGTDPSAFYSSIVSVLFI